MTTKDGLGKDNCIEVTSSNYEEIIAKSALPVVIDFWAPWCAPCRMMKPVFHEVSEELKSKYKFATVNVDENQKIAAQFRAMKIPYFVIVNKNEITKTTSGAMSKSDFIDWIVN